MLKRFRMLREGGQGIQIQAVHPTQNRDGGRL